MWKVVNINLFQEQICIVLLAVKAVLDLHEFFIQIQFNAIEYELDFI